MIRTGGAPSPEGDPNIEAFMADMLFANAYTSLAQIESMGEGSNLTIKDTPSPDGMTRSIYVTNGNRGHTLHTALLPGEKRAIFISLKGISAYGKSNLGSSMTRPKLQLRLSPGWNTKENKSTLYMEVERGLRFDDSATDFMEACGLAEICPDEYIHDVEPGTSKQFEISAQRLGNIVAAHITAANLE